MITLDDCYKLTLDDEKIELSCQNITDQQLIDLVIPYLKQNPQIKKVNLSGNTLKNRGVKALAIIDTLEELYLDGNPINKKGAKALASNSTLRKLGVSCTDKKFKLFDVPEIMAIAYEEIL